jgi:hypothetical protein
MRRKQMSKYITNVNGDWWELHPTHPVWVLDTDDLTAEQFSAIIDEHGGLGNDKFEDVIREYGRETPLNV